MGGAVVLCSSRRPLSPELPLLLLLLRSSGISLPLSTSVSVSGSHSPPAAPPAVPLRMSFILCPLPAVMS